MEPTVEGSPDTQAEVVLARTRPIYALCNVMYCPMRFVNAAGGISLEDISARFQRRAGTFMVTGDISEDE